MKQLQTELSSKPLNNDVNDFGACFSHYRDIVNGNVSSDSEDRHATFSNYVAMIEIDSRKFKINRQYHKSYYVIYGDSFLNAVDEFMETEESSGLKEINIYESDCIKIIHDTHQ